MHYSGTILIVVLTVCVLGCYRSHRGNDETSGGENDRDDQTETTAEKASSDSMGEIPGDTATPSLVDTTTASETSPVVLPLIDCAYLFHIKELFKAADGDDYVPVDYLPQLWVSFSNNLETATIHGQHPFEDEHFSLDDIPLQSVTPTEYRYAFDGELTGEFILRPAEIGELDDADDAAAMSQLDFFGSGLPVVLSYLGFLVFAFCEDDTSEPP